MEKQENNWKPLQSNPEVMNQFMKNLGFDTSKYAVQDLLSTEEWAQEMLPQPVFGVVFLYEINEKQKAHQKQQAEQLKEDQKFPEKLFFMKQFAKNACGTIALFHVVLNAKHDHPDIYSSPSYLSEFAEEAKGKNPTEIGNLFKKSKNIESKHKESVNKGETEVKDQVETHFIAFVTSGGSLYELDGRKKAPINHGKSENLVADSCKVVQQFIDRDPESHNFTILAIGQKPE